jgi:hypothetical protein
MASSIRFTFKLYSCAAAKAAIASYGKTSRISDKYETMKAITRRKASSSPQHE